MASSGSRTRPPCADQEDMPKTWLEACLDKEKEKDVPTPPCWCGDVCKLKVSTDRNKSWTEGRRFFVCPNYAHDRRRPTNAYDIPPSPPPLCKYFTWIDHEVPKDVQEDQRADWLRRQRRFEESFARGLKQERREKEARERKKREQERARKEKAARQEERARKLARARDAREEDEACDKKGKWPRTTQ
ncbi:hypothetical protein CFC21_026886 [Triticum aestivum]|uniref:GRF-type domain-containing protein n=1 Tax=Triticum aestivum TaxID=4565 RepID=A0A9R1JDD1_WHEAT|nr:hypothetical protein CFC21_026886 [Triticum aestivum]